MWQHTVCCLALLAVNGVTATSQSKLDALPASVRDRATVIIAGELTQGRSACIPTDTMGSHRWYRETSLEVQDVLRGKVAARYLQINEAMLPKSKYVRRNLIDGETYLVLLRPNAESMKIIEDREGIFNYRSAMSGDEIVAIVGPIAH